MKIVNIIGGLGNQMFQYAFAVALKCKDPEEKVYVDTQHYKNAFIKEYHGNDFYHNGYEVDEVFPNASIKPASAWDLMKVSYYIPNQVLARAVRRLLPKRKTEFVADQQPYVFIPGALNEVGDCYFDGYWMSPLYFDDYRNEIIKEFEFRPFDTKENLELQPLLLKDNSITIHIRRGDYVGSKTLGGICTLNYYRNAINEAKKVIDNPVFFVFSNDQKWCIENLKDEFGQCEVHFVSNNKGSESFRDMQLMSIARCNILANSSFSWWGAYLNQRNDHITFCPNKWHNTMEYKDHYVKDWIKIDIQ
jgi:hypothetical protein